MNVFFTVLLSILLFILLVLILLIPSRIVFDLKFDGNLLFTFKLWFLKFKFPVPVFYKKKEDNNQNTNQSPAEIYKKSDKKERSKKNEKESLPFPGIKNTLVFIKDALYIFSKPLKKTFRLEKLNFKAICGSEDAAKTAELYGLICTLGAFLHQFAENAKGMKPKNVYIEIVPDFLAENTDVFAEIKFSVRIFRILILGTKGLSVFKQYKKLCLSTQKENTAKNADVSTDKTSDEKTN